jgi:hypothetical protein
VLFASGLFTDALASGWPPFVRDDNATVKRGSSVSILSDGSRSVLDNDFDIERDQLFAYLASQPRHGSVVLNLDGTFTYSHDGSNGNSDDFEYVAFDGTSYSRRARVRIDVEAGDPIAPRIVGQKSVTVAEDASRQITLDLLEVVDPDSSYPKDFTLFVGDGQNYSRNDRTISPDNDFNGQLLVPVQVSDGALTSQWFDLVVEVLPVNDAPFVTGTPPAQEAIEGKPFSLATAGFFADVDNGDVLRFSARNLPGSGSLRIDANTGRVTGTPVRSDVRATPYRVDVIATDNGGRSAEIHFDLTVVGIDRVDLAAKVSLTANPTGVSESAEWVIEVENLGPADLETGELRGSWTTSGGRLSLAIPQDCTVSGNDSSTPEISCEVGFLPAGSSVSYSVVGNNERDGDNTVFAIVTAEDDANSANNVAVTSGYVVAQFSEGASQILDISAADVDAADVDGDDALDIVAIGSNAQIFLNSGQRSFETVPINLGAGNGGKHIAAGDWNGDGWVDIGIAGRSDGTVKVLLNNGKGLFEDSVSIAGNSTDTVNEFVATDFDLDSRTELVVASSSGTEILRSNGQGGTNRIRVSAVPAMALAVGDLNGDSFADIAVVRSDNRRVNLFLTDGRALLFTMSTIDSGSVAKVTLNDIDGDGRMDILLSTDGSDLTAPRNLILEQQNDGSFVLRHNLGASQSRTLLLGDIDGDGWSDVLAVTNGGVHQKYRGSQASEFELDAEQIVSEDMHRGILADFNGDGSLDLVLAGAAADVIEFHANNGLGRLGRGDRTAPKLTILGETRVSIPAGSQYVDQGAVAEDDIEGDITQQIVVSGNVNASTVGTYTITYSVSDRAGNASSATRTVEVGVNSGTGGSGGGGLSPLILMLLSSLVALRRTRASRRAAPQYLAAG